MHRKNTSPLISQSFRGGRKRCRPTSKPGGTKEAQMPGLAAATASSQRPKGVPGPVKEIIVIFVPPDEGRVCEIKLFHEILDLAKLFLFIWERWFIRAPRGSRASLEAFPCHSKCQWRAGSRAQYQTRRLLLAYRTVSRRHQSECRIPQFAVDRQSTLEAHESASPGKHPFPNAPASGPPENHRPGAFR